MLVVSLSDITIRIEECLSISYAAFWDQAPDADLCRHNNRTVHLSFNVGDEVRAVPEDYERIPEGVRL